MAKGQSTALHGAIVLLVSFVLGLYFTVHAVQGEYGLFARIQLEAEEEALKAELSELSAELSQLENKTRRLSDSFLDLDLLDEQARSVLGYVRPDEIVVR